MRLRSVVLRREVRVFVQSVVASPRIRTVQAPRLTPITLNLIKDRTGACA